MDNKIPNSIVGKNSHFYCVNHHCLYPYRYLPLVRAEDHEEQARAQKVFVGCIVVGVLMAVAKPVAYWVTGWNIINYVSCLPTELVRAVDNLL